MGIRIYAIIVLMLILFSGININAQPMPGIPELKEVKGKYMNDIFGVEITLPNGWTGMELITGGIGGVDFILGGFFASPEGDISNIDMDSPIMTMYIIDAKKGDVSVEDTSETFEEPECKALSSSLVDILGVKGFEMEMECTIDDTIKRAKGLFISQEEGDFIRSIIVTFMAPKSLYEQYIDDFENSLRTLKVSNIKQISIPATSHKEEHVIVDGNQINIRISSNSNINEFKFDHEDKSISLVVEGKDDTLGVTDIYLGDVLKGPYTVTVNGTPIEYIPIREQDGTEGIRIVYTHSTKEIKIIGTEVIPEFPIAVLPILAIILGAAILITRNKFSI